MSQLPLNQGDAFHLPLQDKSIHTVITSPPYYGPRKYDSLEPTIFPGGSYQPVPGAPPVVIPGPASWEELAQCVHKWGEPHPGAAKGGSGTPNGRNNNGETYARGLEKGATCRHCGAWLGTHGSEETPPRYIWHTVLWLREVRRCLRDDGVCWVNIGDSFSSEGGQRTYGRSDHGTGRGHAPGPRMTPSLYPAGTLLAIPQQLMLAAMADGWTVRNDCVWQKVSPLPESISGTRHEYARCGCVKYTYTPIGIPEEGAGRGRRPGSMDTPVPPDPACLTCAGTGRTDTLVLRRGSWRHTRAHEVVLMLTKGMEYWSDGEAVREARKEPWRSTGTLENRGTKDVDAGVNNGFGLDGVRPRAYNPGGRNPRSVLTPAPSPFSGAHCATFPPALIEPLIRATCPAQCCAGCGAGWVPVVDAEPLPAHVKAIFEANRQRSKDLQGRTDGHTGTQKPHYQRRITVDRYKPTCACATDLPPVPGVCLDIFGGSGTVGLVARALGRRSILVELSPTYVQLARERLGLTALAAWEGQTQQPRTETYDDLPLFG